MVEQGLHGQTELNAMCTTAYKKIFFLLVLPLCKGTAMSGLNGDRAPEEGGG